MTKKRIAGFIAALSLSVGAIAFAGPGSAPAEAERLVAPTMTTTVAPTTTSTSTTVAPTTTSTSTTVAPTTTSTTVAPTTTSTTLSRPVSAPPTTEAPAPPPPVEPPLSAPVEAGCSGHMADVQARWPEHEWYDACRIIACESGGDPLAENGRSSASGVWQIIDGTWAGYGGYAHASWAPVDMQHDRAFQLWQSSGWRPWSCW